MKLGCSNLFLNFLVATLFSSTFLSSLGSSASSDDGIVIAENESAIVESNSSEKVVPAVAVQKPVVQDATLNENDGPIPDSSSNGSDGDDTVVNTPIPTDSDGQ